MGIVNVTPDSFSDGGKYASVAEATSAGNGMLERGADILDVGGESTRPGALPVPLDEELRRVVPVIEALAKAGARISVDTYKAEVARQALQAGAAMVNDVSALADPEMAAVCAEAACEVCLMHMQGTPQTMQNNPFYEDVVDEVLEFLLDRAQVAEAAGIDRKKIWIDPGFGFGKTIQHNLLLAQNLNRFVTTGYPVLIGVSRKGFLGKVLGGRDEPVPFDDRLPGALAIQVSAQLSGVRCIRTHDVMETRRAISMIAAVADA